jgi:hypothetical protein
MQTSIAGDRAANALQVEQMHSVAERANGGDAASFDDTDTGIAFVPSIKRQNGVTAYY